MATFSIDDLTTPLSKDEVQAKIYDVIGLLGTRTTSWKPGAIARTIIVASAVVLSAFSELQALIARSGFLELAEDRWLALVAWYVYGVRKDYASFASGEVTLANIGGGIYDFDPGDLIVLNPDTGKQFRNTAPVHVDALGTATAAIVAVEAGSASSSAPETIVELVTPHPGLSCSNALAVVGRDDEEDPALRARCSEKLGALSPFGPWDAYSYAARNTVRADGSPVGVTRVRTVKDGFGNVSTYVATASGAVPGSADDPVSDLGLVNESIQHKAAPLAVTASTASATPIPVAVTYRIWMYNTSGLTPAQITSAIALHLGTFFAGQPIGGNVISTGPGYVYLDAIRTAIGAALPQIFHVQVDAPSTDVALAINQVAVLGVVTASLLTQVSPSEGSAL
jgi:uncharacterized phage protein gp47/JayE